MATVVLQYAGQAVGTAIGGPVGGIIGRAVGAVAGNIIDQALFGSGSRRVEGPRESNLSGQHRPRSGEPTRDDHPHTDSSSVECCPTSHRYSPVVLRLADWLDQQLAAPQV